MKTPHPKQVAQPRTFIALVAAMCLSSASLASAAGVKLAWDPSTKHMDGSPVTDLAGYKVHYGPAAAPPYDGIGATEGGSPVDVPVPTLPDATQPEFSLSGFSSCQLMYFSVTAYDSSGNESGFSNVVNTVIVAKPEAVMVSAGSSEGSLLVKWTPPSGAGGDGIVGFRVHYDTDAAAPYEGVGAAQGPSPVQAAPGSSSLALTGLPAGATVFVAVEALCADGAGGLSKEGSGAVAAPQCGNNVIENGETCDPVGSCTSSCDDGVACTLDALLGSPSECTSSCSVTVIDTCIDGDGCCPIDCDTSSDSDCSASCGNGTLEQNETCDPPDTCPASCDDGDACTADWSSGNPQFCSAACSHTRITTCASGDGCCPAGCRALIDNDCAVEPAPPPGFIQGPQSQLIGSCSIHGADGLWTPALLALMLLFRRRRG